MNLLADTGAAEVIKNIFGEAASGEFVRTCSMFVLAAYVHSRQVRKEIKEQFTTLVSVLKQDLDAQQKMLGLITTRLDRIESIVFKPNQRRGDDQNAT